MNLENSVGPVVRFHRKKSGLSQAELAKTAGVGKTVVFDIEKGKDTVRLQTMLRVLEALNIKTVLSSPLMKLYEKKTEAMNEKS